MRCTRLECPTVHESTSQCHTAILTHYTRQAARRERRIRLQSASGAAAVEAFGHTRRASVRRGSHGGGARSIHCC